jgi:hypothetical protein
MITGDLDIKIQLSENEAFLSAKGSQIKISLIKGKDKASFSCPVISSEIKREITPDMRKELESILYRIFLEGPFP